MSLLSLKNEIVADHDDGNNSKATEVPLIRNDNNNSRSTSNNSKNNNVKKLYHWTVCMVPPPSSSSKDNPTEQLWEKLTQCRTELRDPGLFRWPPHANLLYPFIDCFVEQKLVDGGTNSDTVVNPEILEKLVSACRQCEPFAVRLHEFGTFGGKHRGVLWLYPDSRRRHYSPSDSPRSLHAPSPVHDDEPLVRLQSLLVQAFPTCNDQNQKQSSSAGGMGAFTPHMTVTHLTSLEEAEAARKYWQELWCSSEDNSNNKDDFLEFTVDHIYVLTRKGDDGQFLRVVDVPLGNDNNNNKSAIVHNPPIPFPAMPEREPDWVREERMKLKERRRRQRNNYSGGQRRQRSSRHHSRPRGPPDTPEVIAAKRAERKAKREAAAAPVKRDT